MKVLTRQRIFKGTKSTFKTTQMFPQILSKWRCKTVVIRDRPQAEHLQAPPDSRSTLKWTIRLIMLHLELCKDLSSNNSRHLRPHSNQTIINQMPLQALVKQLLQDKLHKVQAEKARWRVRSPCHAPSLPSIHRRHAQDTPSSTAQHRQSSLLLRLFRKLLWTRGRAGRDSCERLPWMHPWQCRCSSKAGSSSASWYSLWRSLRSTIMLRRQEWCPWSILVMKDHSDARGVRPMSTQTSHGCKKDAKRSAICVYSRMMYQPATSAQLMSLARD